jgi:hypothetical protein
VGWAGRLTLAGVLVVGLSVRSVSAFAAPERWAADGGQVDASFGWSASSAGDVNGDGFDDVVVGAPAGHHGQFGEGGVFVFGGSSTGPGSTPAWSAESDQAEAQFGISVGGAGDVNGDGFDDVIIGAFGFDHGQSDEGRAFVYLGSATGLSALPDWTAESDLAGAWFGNAVGSAGDVNGDGFDDVIVGAPTYTSDEGFEGAAFVYEGSATGLSTAPSWQTESDRIGAFFGFAVGSAGDINGDGFDDVVAGAPYDSNGEVSEGRAYLYQGSASGPSQTPNWIAESDQVNAFFGGSVGTAGDVDGDGFDDVIVGANAYSHGQNAEGRAYVYGGSADGLSVDPDWIAEPDQADAYFGSAVATAGDLNGDGFADVVVGAIDFDHGEGSEGGGFVFLGSASGLSKGPTWIAESDQVGANLGLAAATAGDVNGDGFADLLLGAPGYDHGQSNEGAAFVYRGRAG